MLFNRVLKKNKKYLLYSNIRHKFNQKYNKMFKNTIYNLIKDSRYELNNSYNLYIF